jgi:hypothetical protein
MAVKTDHPLGVSPKSVEDTIRKSRPNGGTAAPKKLDRKILELAKGSYGRLTVDKLESALRTIESFKEDAENAVARVREAIEKGEFDNSVGLHVGRVAHAVVWMVANVHSETESAGDYFREYVVASELLKVAPAGEE